MSRLGRIYHVHPPLIIQPLPDPIPRDLPARYHPYQSDGDIPIWRETSASDPEPRPPPPSEPTEPPF